MTAAVPTRPGDDNPLPFAITLASAAGLPIRMLSLVSAENLPKRRAPSDLRATADHRRRGEPRVAARALPDSPEIESLVADGVTLESALKKLNWDDSDLLVVGSSRFAAPKRIFLGSTASRILAGIAAPVIVIPRGERAAARVQSRLVKIVRCQSLSATPVMSLITCLMVRYSSKE